jgi:hypothetical protein
LLKFLNAIGGKAADSLALRRIGPNRTQPG